MCNVLNTLKHGENHSAYQALQVFIKYNGRSDFVF